MKIFTRNPARVRIGWGRLQRGFCLALAVAAITMIAGCEPPEVAARDSIVAFHGYLVSAQSKHTLECIQAKGNLPVCDTLRRADAAQNAAVYALASYCQIALPSATDPGQKCNRVTALKDGLTAALGNLNGLTASVKAAAQ